MAVRGGGVLLAAAQRRSRRKGLVLTGVAADAGPDRPVDRHHPARSSDPITLTVPEIRHLLTSVFVTPAATAARLDRSRNRMQPAGVVVCVRRLSVADRLCRCGGGARGGETETGRPGREVLTECWLRGLWLW
ncbi:hypothetical protein GCM10010359_00440 [Streptomyces morookaense]|nr:hypothetical protein GCM10010359_00440 [Streptomyces morookaense]